MQDLALSIGIPTFAVLLAAYVNNRQLEETRSELKVDISGLRTEVKTEMSDLRNEITGVRNQSHSDMIMLMSIGKYADQRITRLESRP